MLNHAEKSLISNCYFVFPRLLSTIWIQIHKIWPFLINMTWLCMYITWNMGWKKWKQMIRPAIRNVFDSQSTLKSRASCRSRLEKKKEFLLFLALLNFAATQSVKTCTWRQISENNVKLEDCYIPTLLLNVDDILETCITKKVKKIF